jgi:hypothetical protein
MRSNGMAMREKKFSTKNFEMEHGANSSGKPTAVSITR